MCDRPTLTGPLHSAHALSLPRCLILAPMLPGVLRTWGRSGGRAPLDALMLARQRMGRGFAPLLIRASSSSSFEADESAEVARKVKRVVKVVRRKKRPEVVDSPAPEEEFTQAANDLAVLTASSQSAASEDLELDAPIHVHPRAEPEPARAPLTPIGELPAYAIRTHDLSERLAQEDHGKGANCSRLCAASWTDAQLWPCLRFARCTPTLMG
jgi:hypothetical protein